MRVSWTRNEGVLIAKPVGRIYSSDWLDWRSALESGIGPDDNKMVIDFEQVQYLGSAGLRVVLMTAKRFSGPGQAFAVCRLTRPVAEVLTASGFDSLLSVYDSKEAAIAAINRKVDAG